MTILSLLHIGHASAEGSGYVLLIMSLTTIYSHYNQYIVIKYWMKKEDKK
jgi:hypothetical protein